MNDFSPNETGSPVAHVSPSGAALKLLWSQEFNERAGAGVDGKFWSFDIGDGSEVGIPGWGNQEREWYLPEQAATDGNGSLVITATKLPADNSYMAYYGTPADWASAKLHTAGKVSVLHGRIEARVRVPKGAGTWPAFWMLGTDLVEVTWPTCGEIDILEVRGRDPHTLVGTIHGPGYSGEHGSGTEISVEADMSEGFHTFAVEWLPGSISWYIDDRHYQTKTPADVAPSDWVFEHPHYIIMNLAMGGGFTGEIDPALTLAEMAIDHVRVYSIDGVGQVTVH
jgi:beta-glucanase (GH16 family)